MTLSALEALRENMRSLKGRWREGIVDTSGVLVVACEDRQPCPICMGPMHVQKTALHQWENH